MVRLRLACVAGVLASLVACGSESRPQGDDGGSDGDGGDGIPTAEGGDEGDVSSEGGDAGDDMAQRLDVPAGSADGMGTAEGGNEGCEKVDFVFVIDSSLSMEDEQDNLIASFPGFIDEIERTLAIDDFQLMVVDAGEQEGSGCDGALGAGEITNADGDDCGVSGNSRYASSGQSNLTDVFTCMASRGIDGSLNEQTMDALLQSVGPLSRDGECNEGFVRDDAVLVVTLITDEEDSPRDAPGGFGGGACGGIDNDANSSGDPMTWYDSLVAVKGGDSNAVVVLGLLGDCDTQGGCPGFTSMNGVLSGAEPAPRLRQFVTSFTYGTTGPICAEDYSPFFASAVSVIEHACDEFIPVG